MSIKSIKTEVTDSSISDHELQLIYDKMLEDLQPLENELNIAKLKFNKASNELENSFKVVLQKYYDQRFLDKNFTPIKNDSIITDGINSYQVIERGMQIVFGTLIFNNKVICKKLDKDLRQGKKDFFFTVKDLKDFVVQK